MDEKLLFLNSKSVFPFECCFFCDFSSDEIAKKGHPKTCLYKRVTKAIEKKSKSDMFDLLLEMENFKDDSEHFTVSRPIVEDLASTLDIRFDQDTRRIC